MFCIFKISRSGGFILSQPTVEALLKKFPPNYGRGGPGIDFETYLQMSAFLGQIQSTFLAHDHNRNGIVSFNMDQLVLVGSSVVLSSWMFINHFLQ